MNIPDKPTPAADYDRMLGILRDAPPGGLSMDEIRSGTEAEGERWSYRTINSVLCDLGNRVRCVKIRTQRGKVAKYTLRSNP